MTNDLQAQIEERRKQAKDRNISGKAAFVASILGTHYTDLDLSRFRTQKEISYFVSKEFNLFIENILTEGHNRESTFSSIERKIKYKGCIVYLQEGARVTSYIPGEWEDALESLYKRAVPIAKARSNQERLETQRRNQRIEKLHEDSERARWGLQ